MPEPCKWNLSPLYLKQYLLIFSDSPEVYFKEHIRLGRFHSSWNDANSLSEPYRQHPDSLLIHQRKEEVMSMICIVLSF